MKHKTEKTFAQNKKRRFFNIDKRGLKYKNWKFLMSFSLIILVVMWFLQFIFLNTFYTKMKVNEIESIGKIVASKYQSADFRLALSEYARNYNLRIIYFDEKGKMIGSNGFGEIFSQGVVEYFQNIAAFIESGEHSAHFVVEEGRSNMSQIGYIQRITSPAGATNYLYIVASIPPIDSTVSVLRTQFWLITLIIFLLSLFMAQILSKRMSKPIIDLTKSAEKLAAGDLETRFNIEDFTEIEKLSSTLNYATGELSKLDSYRKEFIANVSHDLKTPLTIIKFYAEMIHDVSGENPEKRTAHSEMIIKEADWLSNLVNEILELSKLQSNNVEPVKTELNVSQTLKDTMMSFQAIAEKEGYIFETDIDDDVYISGSEQYIRRVFFNLITNAVNYTGEDKRVVIRLKQNAGKIAFTVTDTGEGIPDELKNTIWERYYKSKETHKRAVMGTGLGLSIVKQCLDMHGARYGIESMLGRGSTFWFEMNVLDAGH